MTSTEPSDAHPHGPVIELPEKVRRGPFGAARRLYDWVIGWAESKHGATALFLLAFAESSFFPIPPDVLLIALCIGAPKRALRFATICTLGSVLGGMFGYFIGWALFQPLVNPVIDWLGWGGPMAEANQLYQQYDVWIVFIAGFSPIPYKVFTILAGFAGLSFVPFVVASVVGRAARFFLVAGLIFKFGPGIRHFIDKYFNSLTLAFVVLLVVGFGVIGLMGGHDREPLTSAELTQLDSWHATLSTGSEENRKEARNAIQELLGRFVPYRAERPANDPDNVQAIEQVGEWIQEERRRTEGQ
ncbi:MAG: YqaA family protein [Planctomycetota bacterium]